jgi:hypothetical protein
MGFIMAPALSPFAFGFLVARAKLVVSFPAGAFVLLTNTFMTVGDGHMELAPCTAYLLFC